MSRPDAVELVKASESPAHALMLLAERVAELEVQPAPTSDSWSSWGDAPIQTRPDEWVPPADGLEVIAKIKEELNGCADADESKVLRAKLELAEDRMRPPPQMVDNEGTPTEQITDADGNVVVELPIATEAQLTGRRKLLPSLGLADQYGLDDSAKFAEAFVKGGPLVLYYSDRDYVNSLPDGVKVALVEDVIISSPREAHEMGRDLLKNPDPGMPEMAIEAQSDALESGAIHNAP